MRLREKVAIVTGAGTGIGKAIAIMFAREGARVVVNGRRAGPLDAVVGEIARSGGTALPVVGDVTRAADVERLVKSAVGALDRLDVLVNNAGAIPERGAVGNLTEEGFRKTLDGNLVSNFLCSKAALPELLKTRGNIVNIASLAGLRGTPNLAAYGAAKGGVVVLTKDMAVDYARRGVRVNCICPAYIETDLNRDFLSRLKGTGEYENLLKLHPLGFLGAPEDVAHGAVYLASNEARWITGIALVIDGGISASR
jgi:NAD(P)-dependent dehydrogenase (short-subunit alcohol dehydrogenase family)